MGLYERWTHNDIDTPEVKITIHRFGAALSELVRGNVTRAQVIAAFNLTGADVTELDAIAAKYAGLSTQAEKDAFVAQLEDVMILAESGDYTRSKCASVLGF